MVRQYSVILGIGLIVLWIAGLSSPFAPAWLSWLDGVAALMAFVIAGSSQQSFGVAASTHAVGPFSLATGLFALWLIALSTAVIGWMTWWNFAFAFAFLALGIAAVSMRRKLSGLGGIDTSSADEARERDRFFKKSA